MNTPSRKLGLSVLECVVAISVLAAMLTVLLSIQVIQSTRISLARQRLVAEQTLGNLASRITSAESGKLALETVDQWAADIERQQGLPEDTIVVHWDEITEPIAGQRIELTWKPQSKVLPRHSLIAWRFKAEATPSEETRP